MQQQQLTIKTSDRATLRPLLRSAIAHERQILALGLERTKHRLSDFESRYGMTSAEFERCLNTLELTETVEFTDWRMEIGMARLLERQYQALRDASFD